MRELRYRVEKLKNLFNTNERHNAKRARELEAELGVELIGEGKDSVVWRYGDKILKIDKRVGEFSKSAQRQTFYIHKILATLFPKNFVAPSLVSDETKSDEVSASVWSPLEGEKLTGVDAEKSSVYAIYTKLRSLNLRISMDFVGTGNVMRMADGSEVYVDTVRNFIYSGSDIEKITTYMESAGYPKHAIQSVEAYGRRLVELQK